MSGKKAQVYKRQSVLTNAAIQQFSDKYDYCLVFKMDGRDGSYTQPQVGQYVVKRLMDAGLEVFTYLSVQDDEVFALIRAPAEKLRDFADAIDYKLELTPEKVKEYLERGKEENGRYSIKPVFINDDEKFTAISPYNYIFGKYDTDLPQELYLDIEDESTKSPQYDAKNPPFIKYVRLKLLHYLMRAPIKKGGCDLELSKLLYRKKILAYFPLHDNQIKDVLKEKILLPSTFPWQFPFSEYRYYFGEKIALYQVFLGHYSHWLLIPSIIGLAFQLVVWGTLDFSHPVLPFYSVVITVWGIVMLENFKQKEKMFAMKWGMTGFESNEPDRPEFRGELIHSYVNGEETLYFPEEELMDRLASSQGIILVCICMAIGVVASIYVLRFSLQGDLGALASFIASILNTVQITVFNIIYQKLAIFLTDSENHRTDTQYEDSLIVKLFSFQFINSYASFFFLAFVAAWLDKSDDEADDAVGQCGYQNCMQPLSINLATIFGTRLVVKNITDIVIPYYLNKWSRDAQTKGTNKTPTGPEEDFFLLKYNATVEGIENFADSAIQYGFSMLFVTALPIASFLSLVSNYVKSKSGGWKLTTVYQRPIPQGAEDIGTWMPIFQIITVAAVITNAGIICFTMDVLDDYSTYGRTWIFIGFQWLLFALQATAERLIPDEPEEAIIQQQRNEFITSKIIDQTPDEDSCTIAEYERSKDEVHVELTDEDAEEKHFAFSFRSLFCKKPPLKIASKKLDLSNTQPIQLQQYPAGGAGTPNPLY